MLLDHDVAETSRQLNRLIDCDEYEMYLRQNLPRRIATMLNREFQIMAEQARQRLVEIVQEQSLETLANFLREKGLIQQGGDKQDPETVGEPYIQDDGSFLALLNDTDLFPADNFQEWGSFP